MRGLVGISLLSVMLLVSLSAYLRLSHSGIGCPDWPACYGQIGEPKAVTELISSENAYQHILAEASQPLAWATPLHRLVASVLGLFIVFLVILAFRHRRDRSISLALLSITVFLALLGLKSGGLHSPAVVMGNLGGGFLMLGLLGWMFFKQSNASGTSESSRRQPVLPVGLTVVALLFLVLQILIGGLTSANFAATSCQTLPDCHGSWLPGPGLWKAMDLSEDHEVTPSGQAIGGQERVDIHKTHRLVAVATALLLLVVGLMSLKANGSLRLAGVLLMILVLTEFSIGVAAIIPGLSITLAVAHNWLAGLLLLAMLNIMALNRVTIKAG
jgi:cytochrome c oxidase assembly protein subunit 15